MRKNNVKRWIAIIIAVALIVGCFPGKLQSKIGAQSEVKAEEPINNPRIAEDPSMDAGQKVTWDCVWFGSYPQTEIVDKPSTCGTYNNPYWGSSTDYVVSPSIYTDLQNAAESEWDSNGDIVIDETKYRRMKKPETHEGSGDSSHYDWEDENTYHYFRYEPIKWRVLDKQGSTALLLADKALDSQKYNTVRETITWETSTIRSWLNGYGAASNKQSVDYGSNNFIDIAFTPEQQGGIQVSNLTNADNSQSKTEGGNDTADRVFLLSESEVCSEVAKSYGFVHLYYYTYDEARRCKSSTYSKAMGTWSMGSAPYTGNCRWWLRTPGAKTNDDSMSLGAANVIYYGMYFYGGGDVDSNGIGVRPALRLNLAYFDLYSYAGTICSDGTQGTGKDSGNSGTDNSGTAGNLTPKTGQITKAGKAANPLKIKGKKATVKYKKLKKKAQLLAISKLITFTKKGKGTMRYTLSSAKKGKKSFKKSFSINPKTGKIRVKKGLKKGTYKLKIKVKAAGNTSYKVATKTVTVKIIIK